MCGLFRNEPFTAIETMVDVDNALGAPNQVNMHYIVCLFLSFICQFKFPPNVTSFTVRLEIHT